MHEPPTPPGLRLPDDAPLVRKLGHELIAHLPVGVYLCNARGNLVTFNPKAAEIWGQSPDLEQGPLKYTGAYRIHTEYGAHIPVDKHPMAAVLITEKPITNLRLVIERRDGTEVPVLSSIVPLFDKEGRVIGFMNSLQDLRQQVAQEQVENNLKNALVLSQRAELLDKLDSSVVHDFTNHLTSLSMTLSLMEKEVGTLGSVPVSRTAAPEPVFARGKARDAKFGRPNEPSSNAASRKKLARPSGLRGKWPPLSLQDLARERPFPASCA